MRPALLSAAAAALLMWAPLTALAQTRSWPVHHRHSSFHARLDRARYGRAYHIPRFSQAEAEAEVHTVYPYRTGLGPPWPDFYATPYYYPY